MRDIQKINRRDAAHRKEFGFVEDLYTGVIVDCQRSVALVCVLQEIRRLRQSGHTMRGTAAALNRQALRTRRGSEWRLEHVARIMKQSSGAR